MQSLSAMLENQLVGGGLVLMLAGSALALLRHVPSQLWNWATRLFVVRLHVASPDSAHDWLLAWIHNHSISQKSRSLRARARWKNDRTFPQLVPAEGSRLMWFNGWPYMLSMSRTERDTGRINESITVSTVGRSTRGVRQILEEAAELHRRPQDEVNIYVVGVDGWRRIASVRPRGINTVVLPQGLSEELIGDLDRFVKAEDWYRTRGIPWRRSIMLHGPPGTGKSSVVSALAGHYRKDLHILNATSDGLSDALLLTLVQEIGPDGILLMEDVDSTVQGREIKSAGGGSDASKLTFAGLLNALDGAASSSGVVTFLTTNMPLESFDAALLRPGRVDKLVYLGLPDADQLARFYAQFCGTSEGVEEFVQLALEQKMSMATAQEYLRGRA